MIIDGKAYDLTLLSQELMAATVPFTFLGADVVMGTDPQTYTNLHTYDDAGMPAPLPPEADPVIAAHVAPPLVIEYAHQQDVSAMIRTTDGTAAEVFRFPCAARHVYRANLRVSGVDAGNGATKIMEGRFAWKMATTTATMIGITVVSDLRDAAAASWAPNCVAQGTEIVFTVTGAAGRTIDWLLVGEIGTFAPEGL